MKPPEYLENSLDAKEDAFLMEMEMQPEFSELADDNSMDTSKEVMIYIYMIVFIIGTPGNIWIIYKLLRARLWTRSVMQLTVSQRSRIFIFALACSDLTLLLTLPLTAIYNYYGMWVFGETICYATITIEMIAKLFSVVLLTVMSLERYLIVCTRLRHVYKPYMAMIPFTIGTIFGVVIPSAIYSAHLTHFPITHNVESGGQNYSEIWVCLPEMPDNVFNLFAQYTFFVGFVIPFIIMSVCYLLLVNHVRAKIKHRKAGQSLLLASNSKAPKYVSEVRKNIWKIAIFHFVCWAPFWMFTVAPTYISLLSSDSEHPTQQTQILSPVWYVLC
ncbi:hypothetical protein WR25_02990 [Diploscapter pachys]|uniref:G-protein coupled receptors family 1 profile domain-containing protein n=1 Tax=Diploscapter pachys TaxID=2018661 RepID=A0A2A2K3S8_9BILA|nr:hypothetical protein WR25_02990 [Diploscapter pachys]